ncbi:hypothetical protein SAMN05421748_117139 [Paractinoplanes atraurantiacus]|uniref:SnoaL-like domain-containing protein n=1 Tax=Paractinoplanes atraurantiacus TaxID=1036182 RepID=A0A285J801_9ACTN|nr:hypothetical protein SAMN05421748_117139 [Actinoplanes atraurantiacus]
MAEVIDAMGRGDREALIRLFHPYLHWTEGSLTVRGRTKVLAHVDGVPAPPVDYELRDGQIYRWVSAQDR